MWCVARLSKDKSTASITTEHPHAESISYVMGFHRITRRESIDVERLERLVIVMC